MRNKYTNHQTALLNMLRELWEQHVYWTRFFIISTVSDLEDLKNVTNRLLQNPDDFAKLLTPFYGTKIAKQFADLLRQHLLIASDLVNAAKKQESGNVEIARRKWYANADEIAKFLALINPYWDEAVWKNLLSNHLEMTEREAVLRLNGNYSEDIKNFDSIEQQALKMADYMFSGIVQQFKFQ